MFFYFTLVTGEKKTDETQTPTTRHLTDFSTKTVLALFSPVNKNIPVCTEMNAQTPANFWDQRTASSSAPSNLGSTVTTRNMTGFGAPLSMAALLFPSPAPGVTQLSSSLRSERVGLIPQGTCARCFGSICGGVDPSTGRPLPERPCAPNNENLAPFNCYYESLDQCNEVNNRRPPRQLLVATLTTAPSFNDVMELTFDQPNYGTAVQTFFSSNN
jgi:hypothetical protein